jgi:hypothetical protein
MARETRSLVGCSAALAVDAALYSDSDEAPGLAGNRTRSAKPQQPRKADAVHPRTCWRCGLVIPPAFKEHRTADDCISGLRDVIALERWAAPIRAKGKRRAAGAG